MHNKLINSKLLPLNLKYKKNIKHLKIKKNNINFALLYFQFFTDFAMSESLN